MAVPKTMRAVLLAIGVSIACGFTSTISSRSILLPRSLATVPRSRDHLIGTASRHIGRSTSLRSSKASESTQSFKLPFDKALVKSIVSTGAFIVLDLVFRRLFTRLQLTFPSSLAGCAALFAFLLAIGEKAAAPVFKNLEPGANLLAKWLPVFFVPSLVTLPLADPLSSAVELLKVAAVVVGGFLFTLLTTSYSVVLVRKFKSASEKKESVKEAEKLMEDASDVVADAASSITAAAEDFADKRGATPKLFSDELFTTLSVLTGASAVGAVTGALLGNPRIGKPLTRLFMLFTTLTSYVAGARFPKPITKLLHPLVTCTALTWTAASAFAAITGHSLRHTLKAYRKGTLSLSRMGAGDLLLYMLGPAVVSLAISMYSRRRLMRDNVKEVGTAVGVSTVGGIFGTALAVRLLDIGSPFLRLSLLSRNITSPLAMAIAGILGADVSLAVSMVVVTGLIGANFGASILDAFRIKDPVARGLGIGAAAHGLGTAAFTNERDAFPFAAIAMALTASAATVTVSIPFLRKMILQLALDF